jgi:hypothetical protein
MTQDDFQAAAEMFSAPRKAGWSRNAMKYRRFESLALAVKFAVEEMEGSLHSITIRTDRDELAGDAIKALYDSEAFPLDRGTRRAAS